MDEVTIIVYENVDNVSIDLVEQLYDISVLDVDTLNDNIEVDIAEIVLPTESESLVEWAQGKDYHKDSITRDADGRITSASVTWPDGSAGVYTATDYNATHEVYDGYTITHTDSGLTVTQAAVTRNEDGAVISRPPLTVT